MMKNIMKRWFYIPMMLMVMGSCSEDEIINESATSKSMIKASLESKSHSRVAISKDNELTWTSGDALKVFNAIGSLDQYTLVSGETSTEGVFELDEDENKTAITDAIGAAYPSGYVTSATTDALYMSLLSLIDLTTETGNTTDGYCALPMYSKVNDGNISALSFKHLGGILRIDLKDLPEGTCGVKMEADKPLSGSFKATLTDEQPVLKAVKASESQASETTSNNNVVTIQFDALSETNNSKVIYAPLPAATYETFVISLIGSDKNETVLKEWENVTVRRASIYTASLRYQVAEVKDGKTDEINNKLSAALGDGSTTTNEDKEGTYQVEVDGEVDASTSTEGVTVTVPHVENTVVEMNFNQLPQGTSDTKPLVIESAPKSTGGDGTEDVKPTEAKNTITVTLPVTTTDNKPTVEIDAPATTVELASSATGTETTTYKLITAKTATNTLVLGDNIVVEKLVVEGGNIKLRGNAKINALENKTDGVVYIFLEDGAQVSQICEGTLPGNFKIATNDEIKQANLEKAFATKREVTLTESVSLIRPLVVESGKTVSLDLGGFTLSKNEKFEGNKECNTADALILVRRGGELIINNGTIDATGLMCGIKMTCSADGEDGEAILTVNGGNIKADSYAIGGNGTRHHTKITINNGNIVGGIDGIFHPQNGTLAINGGNIEGTDCGIELRAGTLIIKGGEIKSRTTEFSANSNGNGATMKGAALAISQHTTNQDIKVSISGGIFVGGEYAIYEQDLQEEEGKLTEASSMSVTDGSFTGKVYSENFVNFMMGGTFTDSEIPVSYLATGYSFVVKEGKYEVVSDDANTILNVNLDKKYLSLSEAISEAAAGNTLQLAEGEYTFPASITLKGNATGSITFVGKDAKTIVKGAINTNSNSPGNYANGLDLKMKNLTYQTANNGYNGGFGHANSVSFEYCKIIGQMYAHSSAPHTFTNCTIDPLNGYLYTYGANCTFTGCTFNSSEGKALQVYAEAEPGIESTVTITGCTFIAAKEAKTYDGKPVTAIDINSIRGNEFTVNITKSTVNGYATGEFSKSILWNIKGGKENITVVIDGETVYTGAETEGN